MTGMTGMDGLGVTGMKAGAEMFRSRHSRPEPASKAEQREHVEQTLTERTLQRRADVGDEEAIEELDRRARRLQDTTSTADEGEPR